MASTHPQSNGVPPSDDADRTKSHAPNGGADVHFKARLLGDGLWADLYRATPEDDQEPHPKPFRKGKRLR